MGCALHLHHAISESGLISQGYLQRPDWRRAVRVPFVQVPAGSGNALAANCGLWTPETAAYALCKGKHSPIDIASVAQPGRQRSYSFLTVAFGLISNLDVGTDHLRCDAWLAPPACW